MDEKKVEQTVKNFKEQFEKAVELSENPEELKWAIFPSGDAEIESKAMIAVLRGLLVNVKSFHYYREDVDQEALIEELEGHLQELKKHNVLQKLAKNADEHSLELKTGV